MRYLITLALLTLARVGSAQIYFNEQIDWQHNFEYYSGVKTFDNAHKVLITGGVLTLNPTFQYFYLTLLDDSGQVIWNKAIQLADTISGNSSNLLAIDSQNALVQGTGYVFRQDSSVDLQIFLLKIDYATGEIKWAREYGKVGWENSGRKIISSADGGYALLGSTIPIDKSIYTKILMTKIDSLGNQTFRKEYTTNSNRNHFGWALTQTADSGYLLVADNYYDGICTGCNVHADIREINLIKTDMQGKQQWVQNITPYAWKQIGFAARDIQPLTDGSFLLCGSSFFLVASQVYTYYSKHIFFHIGADGSILDSISINGGADTYLERMIPVSDGNFLAMGLERDSSFGIIGNKGVLLKITPDLKLLWKREYRVSPVESRLHEDFKDAVELPDGGFVVCGRAFGPLKDSTNSNGWVIRVDSLGCLEPGCDTLYTAVLDPPGRDAEVLVFPNPTTGQFRLAAPEGAVLLGARLLDLQGRVLEDVQFLRAARVREAAFSLDSQPAGVYVLMIRTDRGWVLRKVVKGA